MNAAKILLVDSDPTLAAALQQQLRALDNSAVGVAMDGAEAIGRAWQLRPEVVVIEYPLPGEIDTRLAIQTIRSQLSPAVVLITESSLEEVSAYADDLAPLECLQKPFSARELQAVITLARYKRQAEAKLATAMQRLQGTQLGTRDAFWDRDLVKQEVYYSYRWFEMIGYTPDELPTTLTLREELTHPDDRARVAKLRSDACEGTTNAYEYEMRLRHKAGHYVPILVRGAIMRDSAGKVIRMSGANTDLSQEKRLQGELRAQRDFATLIVETMGQGLSVTDANGRMEFVNTALARLCGREPADIVGRLTEDIIVTEDRATQTTETVRRRAGARSIYEIRLLRPDGSSIPVEVTAVPRWREGNFAGAIAVVNDLTERKRAEAALLASEEQLKFALEATHDGLWDWNIQTGEVHLSPQGSRLLGYESGEITPLTDMFYALVHPEDTELLIAQGKTHLAAGTPFMQCEIRLRMKDGGYRWFLDRGKVVSHDAIGKPLRMVGTITDIAARKSAEMAMRESEGRYRALVEWTPEPILVHREGMLIYVNPAFVRLVGAPSPSTLLGTSLLDFVHVDDRALVIARMERTAKGELVAPLVELRGYRLDGTIIHAETQGTKISYDGLPAVHVVVRDISMRKSLEAQLRESQKMEAIGTLAGGIAHDFNNILATILGNTELAREDAGANPHALESLNEIKKAATRARDLVQQILSFSRRQPTALKRTSLGPIIEESVQLLRATLPARVTIEVRAAANVPAVLADGTQIQQALINLATNAMQAMHGSPGKIEITLECVVLDAELVDTSPSLRALYEQHPGPTVRLEVRDDGRGMDRATVGRIFEPFFTTKAVDEGTGLGLSVVHGIVRGHEGAIMVESESGRGSTFTIFLPVAPTETPVDSKWQDSVVVSPTLPTRAAGQHILYVDDDESLVFLVERLLGRRGHRVSGHTDQREALALLRANPEGFDLVVTDYNMPGLSGLDVARAVHEIRAEMPVAIVSGFIDEAMRAEAERVGVREVIFKASSVEDFCEAFAQSAHLLGARTTSQEIAK